MPDEVVFSIRLTTDDWDAGMRAWRCPALEIPTAYISEALDPKGQPIAEALIEIGKGPARVKWKGGTVPSLVTLAIQLGEVLSPASEERRWKNIAIIAPVISAVVVALIGAIATIWTKPIPPAPLSPYTLRLRVEPNDIEAAGLPPAKITINNEEMKQPVNYFVKADFTAVVDVSKAIETAKDLRNSYTLQFKTVQQSLGDLNAAFQFLSQLTTAVNGNLCGGGGPSGVPSPIRGPLNGLALETTNKLRAVEASLQGTVGGRSKP